VVLRIPNLSSGADEFTEIRIVSFCIFLYHRVASRVCHIVISRGSVFFILHQGVPDYLGCRSDGLRFVRLPTYQTGFSNNNIMEEMYEHPTTGGPDKILSKRGYTGRFHL
jgi:hypothetical protein